MAKILRTCSWLLAVLGACVTFSLHPHPIMFLPYIFLALATGAARRLAIHAVVLVLTLTSVCVHFWYNWDAAYDHLSTLNFMPRDVAVLESLIAGAAWRIIRRSERAKYESDWRVPSDETP